MAENTRLKATNEDNISIVIYQKLGHYLDVISSVYKIIYSDFQKNKECRNNELLFKILRTFKNRIAQLSDVYKKVQEVNRRLSSARGTEADKINLLGKLLNVTKKVATAHTPDYYEFLVKLCYQEIKKCAEEVNTKVLVATNSIERVGMGLITSINNLTKIVLQSKR